jgi:K+-sensing histidine kinase KdpD
MAQMEPVERELLAQHAALLADLQRLRETAMSQLMASVAQDVRSSVASIVYSADVLEVRGAAMDRGMLQETVRDICEASRRLQLTVDGLLDYARVGPAIAVPVSLSEVITRAHGVLRTLHRDGFCRLRLELAPGVEWLRGNPVVIEQIFVNVLLAAARESAVVSVSTTAAVDGLVQLMIGGDGEPARTSKPEGEAALDGLFSAHLALLDASAAAESQGGQLRRDDANRTPRFTLSLPRSEGPR